jgi:hypothetical protein
MSMILCRYTSTPAKPPKLIAYLAIDTRMGQASMNSVDFVSSDDRSPEAKVACFLPGVRHILVPIDLAQDSLRTTSYAIRSGQHFGSRLTLLHVYQPPIAFGIPSWTSRILLTISCATRPIRFLRSAIAARHSSIASTTAREG